MELRRSTYSYVDTRTVHLRELEVVCFLCVAFLWLKWSLYGTLYTIGGREEIYADDTERIVDIRRTNVVLVLRLLSVLSNYY